MPTDERPEVIASEVDPDVECVRIDGPIAQPPGPSTTDDAVKLCPDGYTPRLRGRGAYTLDGKRIVRADPPIPNPDDQP